MKNKNTTRCLQLMGVSGLLLCLVALGCDGLLGINGLEVGCIEGAKRCSPDFPKWRQKCNVDWLWQDDQPCSTNSICEDGECVLDCANGNCACTAMDSPKCIDNAPAYCNGTEWLLLDKCIGQTCMDARCQGKCESGTARCLGDTPQTCSTTGTWEAKSSCGKDEVCIGGSCSCKVGDRRCFANTPQLCNTSNQWVNDGDRCIGQTCVASTASCDGVCEPEQKQCASGANATQKCGPDGQWELGELCSLGCVEGTCVACIEGESRCTGNTRQTCGTKGQWIDEEVCINQTCIAGICQGQCAPNAKRCSSNYPQTCDASGMWENSLAGCGPCGECNEVSGSCNAIPLPTPMCNQPTVIATGAFHTCALLPNKTLQCWGYNASGQLGLGDTNNRGDNPNEMGQDLPRLNIVAENISAGTAHTCARLSTGGVQCWGNNTFGQLGLGDTNTRGDQPNEMGTVIELGGIGIDVVSAGETHTCALASTGAVKCWGGNYYGQLGLGDTKTRGDEPNEMGASLPSVELGANASLISAGSAHTCVRLSSIAIKCWGNNQFGQLGLGDKNHRGDNPNEMGNNLAEVDIGLPPGIIVKDIRAGATHSCALLSDGTVKCWGNNQYGQLGLGDTNHRGDQPNEMGLALKPVELDLSPGLTVTAISAGTAHTCVLLSNGRIKCWGRNDFGQLGLGDTKHRGDEPNEMGPNLPMVDLGVGVTALEVHAGHSHTCALLSSGRVKCWGRSVYGQLGLSETVTRGDESQDMGDALPHVDL